MTITGTDINAKMVFAGPIPGPDSLWRDSSVLFGLDLYSPADSRQNIAYQVNEVIKPQGFQTNDVTPHAIYLRGPGSGNSAFGTDLQPPTVDISGNTLTITEPRNQLAHLPGVFDWQMGVIDQEELPQLGIVQFKSGCPLVAFRPSA